MADFKEAMMDHIRDLENEINADRRLIVLNCEDGDREGTQYYKGAANQLFDVAEKLASHIGMRIEEEMTTYGFPGGRSISYRAVHIHY